MKFKEYLTIILFVALSLIPPINFVIKNPPLEAWLWLVLISGFFGVFLLFMQTDLTVKIVAIATFVNCFFSAIPYLSFTSYINIIVCCYFYVLCTRVNDWTLIFKAIQSVMILNIFLIFMQSIGHDPLLNFGVFNMEHYGILGQHMMMGSFLVIISAILLNVSKFYILVPILLSLICHSSWSFLCAGLGVVVYLSSFSRKLALMILVSCVLFFVIWVIKDGKIQENLSKHSGRVTVWERSFELSNQRPWFGWGAGTYKDIFPAISNMNCIPWKNSHNFVIQFLFEFGYPLTICLLLGLGWLLFTLYWSKQWLPLAGLTMMITDALIHFPDRMIQTVPLIILFLAYVQFINRRYNEPILH